MDLFSCQFSGIGCLILNTQVSIKSNDTNSINCRVPQKSIRNCPVYCIKQLVSVIRAIKKNVCSKMVYPTPAKLRLYISLNAVFDNWLVRTMINVTNAFATKLQSKIMPSRETSIRKCVIVK